MSFERKLKLPRLPREWDQGRAAVFWTHTIEDRKTGWLDERFPARFREVVLPPCARYALACPAYVVRPDHWHVVWLGLAETSDQHTATRFLREHLGNQLGAARWQDRAHDSVLREEQRRRGAFGDACAYVRENPVRAGLCVTRREWPFAGARVAGYPDLEPRDPASGELFWRIYAKLVKPA
jgi:REP element-mobilizing transposase RayT